VDTVTVGIIGGGFVGSAFARVFQHYTDVKVFDTDKRRATHSLVDTVGQDVLFVCLPTPMRKDGTVDHSIVLHALEQIRDNVFSWKPVILKSTLPPRDLMQLHAHLGEHLYLIFSPEFLTERTAEYDLQQSTRFIFGVGNHEVERDAVARELVTLLFENRFPLVPRYWTTFATASLVKYFTNVFFATKVALLNEFFQIAIASGVNPSDVISLVMLDPRIGHSHYMVPGHDGQFGFGGSCFLKDLNGYTCLARNSEPPQAPIVGQAAWRKNVEVRGAEALAKELSELTGRAASEPMTADEVRALVR